MRRDGWMKIIGPPWIKEEAVRFGDSIYYWG